LGVASGDRCTGDRRTNRWVNVADLRLDFEIDLAVLHHDGQEGQLRAEGHKGDGNRAKAGRLRNRLLPTGKHRCRTPTEGDQLRLGKNLGQALIAQGLEQTKEGLLVIEHAQEEVRRLPVRSGNDIGNELVDVGSAGKTRANVRVNQGPAH